MTTKTYQNGEVIFRQGDFAHGMYNILKGSVGIYLDYGKPTEKKLSVLGVGEFLGEMGMIEVYPRSATAVAEEDDTQLREIDEKEFSDYFREDPTQLLAMMRQMSGRLRERTEDYRAACQILEELNATRDNPGKRSKTLKEKIEKLLDYYNTLLLSYPYSVSDSDLTLMEFNNYSPYNFYHF